MAKTKRGLIPKEHQVKIPEKLWSRIGEIAEELEYGHGGHTSIIHEMLSAAVSKWKYSPYVCRTAQHVVLITEQGDVFYRLVQEIKLNYEREKLPCMLEMKPEKRKYYADQYSKLSTPGLSRGDWFRSRWLINHFSVWEGLSDFTREALICGMDQEGAILKMVDLPLRGLDGWLLTREVVVGLRDYVQWKESETPKFDRVEFNVDIPTRNLKAIVVIDNNLYKDINLNDSARLDLEFRNREWARFTGRDIVDEENPLLDIPGLSSSLDEKALTRMREQVEGLLSRLRELAKSQVEDVPVATESDRVIIEALKMPERFLFFEIDWPSPHLGIDVCVHWGKPPKG